MNGYFCKRAKTQMKCRRGSDPKGRGGTLIFSYIRRLGSLFCGFGVAKYSNIFGVLEIPDIFGVER